MGKRWGALQRKELNMSDVLIGAVCFCLGMLVYAVLVAH